MASRVSPHPPNLISISTRFESKSAACLALALASHELSHFSENFGENDLVRGALPNDSSLVDLGQHRLRDVAEMEHVFQLEHPELRSDFPPLTTSSQSRECESGISPPLHQ